MVAMYVALPVACSHARRGCRARWTIGTVVAVHAVFFLAPPMALTDVFNYINYGRMEIVHHLNPYTTIPILEPHNDPTYALSNWHELLSPYGPLFTLLTFALVPLGVAGSFWAIKAILVATSLGTILLVWRCAQMLDRDPAARSSLVGSEPDRARLGAGRRPQRLPDGLRSIVLGFYLLLPRRSATPPTVAARGCGRSPMVGAGVAFVAATALKASAGGLDPNRARQPAAHADDALTQVLLGYGRRGPDRGGWRA